MKVTIGIPAYNTEKYIADAINSCYNQTIKPEIIVVDDGSTDKTVEIVENLANLYKNIKLLVNNENKGIGYTRKKIVEECKTEYLAFCSADDMLERNYIETMLNYAKHYPDAIFYSDYKLIDEEGNEKGVVTSQDFNSYEEFANTVVSVAKQDRMFICYNIFAPTKLLKENNFDEEKRFGEDLEHLLRCVLIKRIPYVHVPFPLFKYRIHRKMVTQQRRKEIHENNLDTFRKIEKMGGRI